MPCETGHTAGLGWGPWRFRGHGTFCWHQQRDSQESMTVGTLPHLAGVCSVRPLGWLSDPCASQSSWGRGSWGSAWNLPLGLGQLLPLDVRTEAVNVAN